MDDDVLMYLSENGLTMERVIDQINAHVMPCKLYLDVTQRLKIDIDRKTFRGDVMTQVINYYMSGKSMILLSDDGVDQLYVNFGAPSPRFVIAKILWASTMNYIKLYFRDSQLRIIVKSLLNRGIVRSEVRFPFFTLLKELELRESVDSNKTRENEITILLNKIPVDGIISTWTNIICIPRPIVEIIYDYANSF